VVDPVSVSAPRRRKSAQVPPIPSYPTIDGGFARQVLDLPDWIFDALPVAAYACNKDGSIIRFNRRAAELWGREPSLGTPDERFCGSLRMYRADGTPIDHEHCLMAEVLRTGKPVRGAELEIERVDGSRLVVLVNINPVTDTAGRIVGAVNCFDDISDRKHIENEERRSRALVEDLSRKLIREGARLRESELKFEALMANLPAAVYTTDAEGRITYFNDAAVALWGCTPELGKSEFCGSWKIYLPDGTPLPHEECPMAVALKTREPVRGIDAVAERPDGTRVPFLPFPTPLFGEDGELLGAVNMLIDISERSRTELAVQRLAAIVEGSDDAIVSKDLKGIVTSWNQGAERLYGYSAEEMIGKPISTIIPPARHDEEVEILRRIGAGDQLNHFETVRQRKDGSLVDVSLTVSPVKKSDGTVIGVSKIARDISDQKRAEETKELLLHEIKHRVKNTLATVQSIASQTFRKAPVEERTAFIARLHSLANAYDLLTRHHWGRTPLQDVVQRAVAPFEEHHGQRFAFSGPEASLDPGKALLLVLILHELGTNAIKYGALSNGSGAVSIGWELTNDGTKSGVRLCWRESGGPNVKAPRHKGFGTQLIHNALKHDLGGAKIEFSPAGVVCTVNLAL
jgi:PAS domain S-box-containing protein